MSCQELRVIAKELGIRGWSNSRKADLTNKIENHRRVKALLSVEPTVVTEPVAEPQTKEVFESKAVEEVKPAKAVKDPTEPKQVKNRKKSSWDDWLTTQSAERGISRKQAMQLPKEEYQVFKANWTSAQ